jgi:zinc transporter 2
MESTPAHIDPSALQNDLLKIPGVQEVHDLHIWSVSTKRIALSAHVIATSPNDALNQAHQIIEKKYNIHHMTIQTEDPSSFESRYCYDCQKDRK